MKTGKNVLRYLAGTRDHGLEYKINFDSVDDYVEIHLEVFADASFEKIERRPVLECI